jgi:hypothetical protein
VTPYTWKISNKLPLGYQQSERNKGDEILKKKKKKKKKKENGGQSQ